MAEDFNENSSAALAPWALSVARERKVGVLATNSHHKPGFPFVSVTPFVLDAQNRPVFLMSSMAVHTNNLANDPKASLFVSEEDDGQGGAFAASRGNITGEVRQVAEAEDAELRSAYVKEHPKASVWAGFGDFRIYRMEIDEIYFVGGFGRMGYITPQDFIAAQPE
jgi:heme oxygenase (biliverdin-IX-beta and delta-forming)